MTPVRRHLLALRRMATAWMMVVSVVVGFVGFGASLAWDDGCGAACPCDHAQVLSGHEGHGDAVAEGHQGVDGEHDVDDEHDGKCPGDEDCPDDCADCGCCSGPVLAFAPIATPSVTPAYDSLTVSTSSGTPPCGARTAVYRPPRSLG